MSQFTEERGLDYRTQKMMSTPAEWGEESGTFWDEVRKTVIICSILIPILFLVFWILVPNQSFSEALHTFFSINTLISE
jgi:hypothetical protein